MDQALGNKLVTGSTVLVVFSAFKLFEIPTATKLQEKIATTQIIGSWIVNDAIPLRFLTVPLEGLLNLRTVSGLCRSMHISLPGYPSL